MRTRKRTIDEGALEEGKTLDEVKISAQDQISAPCGNSMLLLGVIGMNDDKNVTNLLNIL
jgi:hypothetical protein